MNTESIGIATVPANWVRAWPGWLAWAATWAAMFALDGALDLANLAMVLVLGSALASLWLPGWFSAVAGAIAVAAFNWAFVPPRYTFDVDLHEHALLLAAMLVVNAIVSGLVVRQRSLFEAARRHAQREQILRCWGDTLRDAAEPQAHASALQDALAAAAGVPVAVTLATAGRSGAHPDQAEDSMLMGDADADQRAGLALCVREGKPLGPASGHYEEQPDWYLPLRGRGATLGAAVLRGLGAVPGGAELRAHAQALCDQMGLALQRALAFRDEQRAREEARDQGVRNALLAAISHDYRTPLAKIMGAASSLAEQADRLGLQQRQRLAEVIVEESERLSRLTDNTLQLARLDAPGVQLRCDWESAEEIVGAAMRRARRRPDGARLRARLEPGLPLLWCDAMLVSQLLDNLVDNALRYSPGDAPVEILVRQISGDAVLAVRDRGPGVEPAWRERIFDVFQRGSDASRAAALEAGRAGAGVGLAVCRAIAGAHGGELRLRARAHGGCAFEFWLPLREPPLTPVDGESG